MPSFFTTFATPKECDMKNNLFFNGLAAFSLVCASCATHYTVENVARTRILIDSTYDATTVPRAEAFIQPYKHVVDSIMSPVIGHTAHYMNGHRPESPLSNLLADILVWAAKDYGETPVLGVYNMGGIRAALPAGDVTFGDVLDVAPFENKICFLTLSGEKLTQLFEEMAAVGGEGVSHGVELIIKDRKLLSAKLNGQAIDPQKEYRIATINYLAEGNDHLTAFKAKTQFVSPQEVSNNTRFIIANYFKEMAKEGKVIDSKIEGRITVEK